MLKNWNKLEKTLLFGSIVLVSTVAFIFKSDLLTTICSIVGIITALLLAKGKSLGQLFGILITILYSIVSFKNKFYGEVIIYLLLMLPMYIMGVYSWIKHTNKETNTVEVNKINKNEWILVSIILILVFIGIYFLLRCFNTNELIVSTISVVDNTLIPLIEIASAPPNLNSFNNSNKSLALIGYFSLSSRIILTPSPLTLVFPNNISVCFNSESNNSEDTSFAFI